MLCNYADAAAEDVMKEIQEQLPKIVSETVDRYMNSKSVEVKVDEASVKSVKSKAAKAPLSSRVKLFKEKMQAKWYVFRAQLKYWWLSRKKWQKALWIALLALWLGMLIASIGNKPEPKVSSDPVQTACLIR